MANTIEGRRKLRVRGKPYSEDEKTCVVNIVVDKYQDIIERKETDSKTNKEKEEAWVVIAKEFNSITRTGRTPAQLRQLYKNLKGRTRRELAAFKADGESLLILEKNQEKLVSNIKEFYPWLCAFQNGDDILYSNDSVSNDENPVPKFLLDDLDQSVNQEPEEESPPEPFRQIPAAPTSVNRKQFPVRRKVKSSLFNFREQKILLMKKESTIKMRHLNEEHELKMELMKCDIELKRVQIEIAKKELAKM